MRDDFDKQRRRRQDAAAIAAIAPYTRLLRINLVAAALCICLVAVGPSLGLTAPEPVLTITAAIMAGLWAVTGYHYLELTNSPHSLRGRPVRYVLLPNTLFVLFASVVLNVWMLWLAAGFY